MGFRWISLREGSFAERKRLENVGVVGGREIVAVVVVWEVWVGFGGLFLAAARREDLVSSCFCWQYMLVICV